MHITAPAWCSSTTTSRAARGLSKKWLEALAPFRRFTGIDLSHHNRTAGEDNADAHLKRQVMGREVVVAITGGKLDFGPWEQIFYGEFDGGDLRVLMRTIGE